MIPGLRDIGYQHALVDIDLRGSQADPAIRFAVINGMSANTGMRWDIEYTKKLVGYEPQDDVTRGSSE